MRKVSIQSLFGYLTSASQHRVFKNFTFLATMNVMNYLIPLITFPYIIRVVGLENYGHIAFAMATISYFIVLTDYGFTFSATRDIAANKSDLNKLAQIYGAVLTIKAFLIVLSFILLTLLILSVPIFRQNTLLLYVSFGVVFGNALMPLWFFQGVQQMGYITLLDLGAKLLFAILLFVLVKIPSDYILVPALTGLGSVASGIIGIAIVQRKFGIRFYLPEANILRAQLYGGWHIFTTRIFLNLYTNTNIVLLGFFTNQFVVGQYAIASKIIAIFKSFFDSANQALYPHLVTKLKNSANTFYREVRRLTGITISASLCVTVVVYFLVNPIVTIICGANDPTVGLLLSILLIGLIFSPLGGLYTNSLIVVGKALQFQRIMFWTALLNLFIAVPSIMKWGAVGLALTSVLVSVCVIILCINTLLGKRPYHVG